jgi:CRISPR-associated endonuclease Csn1
MERQFILGLDLGPNSVGWALIEERIDGNDRAWPVRLVDAGVRIFPEGVEADKSESKNVARRRARAMRRQHDRRNRRRDALRHCLQDARLLPRDDTQLKAELLKNPYELRARGLDNRLSPFEFGRALYHLGQRRGFKSNRRTDKKSENTGNKKIGEDIKAEIGRLEQSIKDCGARTLGEYLNSNAVDGRTRRLHTSREMYEREFNALWNAQRAYHSNLLSDELRQKIHHIIFFQRPLKVQKYLVGACALEPRRKRSRKGTWYAQQFRLLQDVSNLKYSDRSAGEWRALNDDERTKLVTELQKRKEMTFDRIRKTLGLSDSQKFNFETADHRGKLKGNQTEWRLRSVLKKTYDKLTAEMRDEIVRDLLFLDNEETLRRHAKERWGMSDEEAQKLLTVDLEPGYLHLSEHALRALIPYLEQGLPYMDAVAKAGYQRPDQRQVKVREQLAREDMPELRNPIVTSALNQMRQVVNAIVREYGKPTKIRVEMARDLKVSLKKRGEMLAEQKENQRAREEAADTLKNEFGRSNPTDDDLLRYRLWKEQKQTCPYTGQTIPQNSLFSPDWEIDHIIPRRRSGDHSYMNKVLCAAQANREKGNKTPWEIWGGDEKRWGEITQRIDTLHLPSAKKHRFLTRKVDDEFLDNFISRQLNDTRYIAREARAYLETLVGKDNVQIARGQVTAELRRRWGLNNILSDSKEKSRADHRHHAIDAVLIALTTPKILKKMSQLSASGQRLEQARFEPPWENFREDVKRRIETILVSHRVIRKLHGALHQETNYGILDLKDEKGQALFAVRKELKDLTQAELERIADSRVRNIVIAHLRRYGADPDTPRAEGTSQWKKAMNPDTPPPCLPNRNGAPVPIRRVRLHKPLTNAITLKNRAVNSGSNHHIVIFEHTDGKKKGKWNGEVVTMFEAARRVRPPKGAPRAQPLIQRNLGDGKRFVMSLAINEIVKVNENGQPAYWRVQKIDAASCNVTFRLHTASGLEDNSTRRIKSPEPLRQLGAVKVVIDLLGRERPAND